MHGYSIHLGKVNFCGYCSMNSVWTVTTLFLETREKKKRTKRKFTNADAASAQSKWALGVYLDKF